MKERKVGRREHRRRKEMKGRRRKSKMAGEKLGMKERKGGKKPSEGRRTRR